MINIERSNDGEIVVLRLPNSDMNNAIQWEFEDSCTTVSQDSDVRVVILTSSSPDFVSSALENNFGLASSVSLIKQPVLGVIDDSAHGLGLELLLASDVRICASKSTFSMAHVAHGAIPSDGGTQRLPRLVGQGRALELILTGRVVGAQEALEMGMVHQVCDADPLKEAFCIAEKIAGHGPRAAQYLKEAVYTGSDRTLRQGMSLEADMSVILQSTLDRIEGINSFLERRAPKFKGD